MSTYLQPALFDPPARPPAGRPRSLTALLDFPEAQLVRFLGELYPFQRAGVDFMRSHRGRALIADEMGLGKTIQALAYLAEARDPFPALVLAPGALLTQWEAEAGRFIRIGGKRPTFHRLAGINGRPLPKADFYLAHYDLIPPRKTATHEAPGRAPDLLRAGFKTLILDEAQALRHRETGRFRALRDLIRDAQPENVLALSGTPLYNHGHEFWPLLHAVRPDLVGGFAQFTSEWCYKLRGENYMIRYPRQFAEMLAREVMLRRTKSEVAPQLPAKRRMTQAVEVDAAQYDAEMRAIAAQYYDTEELSMAQRRARSMAALSKERCISGLLKVPAVADWVAEMLDADPERQVLLFAHHAGVIEGYMRKLARFNPVRYTGLDNADDRAEAMAEFKAGRSRIFIASLRVAGLGLNLQCANTVVFAEYDWSPAVHQQAEDRCHRIGQEREVTSYFAFAPATLDGFILGLCNSKEAEIGAVLGAAETATSERLALQAVAELERRLGVTGRAASAKPEYQA